MSTNQVLAVCPGSSFAIGNVIHQDGGISRWNVYDNNCNVVDGLSTNPNQNPCTQGVFGCSAAPIIFNAYTSTTTGDHYVCRSDPNAGTCTTDAISVCCTPSVPPSTSSTTSQTAPLIIPTTSTTSSITGKATSALSPSSRSSNTSGGGISSGAIAGIVIVVVLVLLVVIGTLLYCKTRRGHGKGMFSAGQEPGMRPPSPTLEEAMPSPFAYPISRPTSTYRWEDRRPASTVSPSVWNSGRVQSPASDRTSTNARPLDLPSEGMPPPYNPEWEDRSDRSDRKMVYQHS